MQEGRRTGNLLTAGQRLFRRTREPLTPSGYGRSGTSRAFGWAGRHARAQSLPAAVSAAPGVGRGCWTAARGRLGLTLACALLPSQPEEPSTWTSYVGKMFMAATNYLPTQVSDMMNQDRAFATGRLGFSGHRNICTLSTYVQRHPSSGTNHYRFASPKHRFTCPRHTHRFRRKAREGSQEGHARPGPAAHPAAGQLLSRPVGPFLRGLGS